MTPIDIEIIRSLSRWPWDDPYWHWYYQVIVMVTKRWPLLTLILSGHCHGHQEMTPIDIEIIRSLSRW